MIPSSPYHREPSRRARLRRRAKLWAKWKAFTRVAQHFSGYVRRQRHRLLLAQVLGFIHIGLGVIEPWPIKFIFDSVFLDKPLPAKVAPLLDSVADRRIVLLNVLIGAIVVIALLRGLVYYYQQLLTARAGQQIAASMRLALYRHLQYLSPSFHDRRRTGDLLSRLMTDIRVLRSVLISVPQTMIVEFFLMVGMLVVMFLMDVQLTLIAFLAVPLLLVFLHRYRRPLKDAIRTQREREGHLASMATEVLGAFKVVQGFHRENLEVKRFGSDNKKSLRSGLRASRLEAKMRWASEMAVAVATAVVLGVAARRVLSSALSPGDLLVFASYMRSFNRPLRRMSRIAEQLTRGAASGERIWDLMQVEPSIKDSPQAVDVGSLSGTIRFENVHFAYQRGETILHDIDLRIRWGENLAIVGSTGSGKSTLVSLLPRFYDPTAGRISIAGRDIREMTLHSLRSNIGLVFQEPLLFATTIAENIAYGQPEADMAEIERVSEQAGIRAIIEELPHKYDTVLGERGATLSGGQRQCVAIARAMIKNAPIVLLDEPTANLDKRSAALVMAAIRRLVAGRTTILISHQDETVRDADRVIVLREGRIVQEGTPSLLDGGKHLEREARLGGDVRS